MINGLLLLAAYFWPSGDPYDQSGVFMVPWEASSELCVLVKSCGAGERPVVLIFYHFRVAPRQFILFKVYPFPPTKLILSCSLDNGL